MQVHDTALGILPVTHLGFFLPQTFVHNSVHNTFLNRGTVDLLGDGFRPLHSSAKPFQVTLHYSIYHPEHMLSLTNCGGALASTLSLMVGLARRLIYDRDSDVVSDWLRCPLSTRRVRRWVVACEPGSRKPLL